MKESENRNAVLVSIAKNGAEVEKCESCLDELTRLLETAGGTVVARVIQIKDTFDPRTTIGSGKVREIAETVALLECGLVVFDYELSPAQIRNLETDIGHDVRVIDRSMLILDIFALHAVTGEGKTQVELAQLRYCAPRLTGHGAELSRQGGGIGSRGPGESKLETDKRHLHERIHSLEERLAELEKNRATMRSQRDRSGLPKLALVGYTNAGKSTLLNALTDAGVLTEDKLFATLDPTTRKMSLPSGNSVLLSDTVGFIRKLPHHLVEAFRSTLDEVKYADLLLIVSDITDPEVQEHLAVTEQVISDLGASGTPRLYVYNKCDKIEGISYLSPKENTVCLSAKEGNGLDALLLRIDEVLNAGKKECDLLIPYERQGALSALYKDAVVEDVKYEENGIFVRAVLDTKARGIYQAFITETKQ